MDEDFARRYWPNGGALGQRVFQGTDSDDAHLFTIVGVVGAVKQAELTEPQGQGAVYVPYRYRDTANIFVVARTNQLPEAFADSLRKLLRATHPELAIDDIRSMDARIAVAGLALLLAAIGIYGVLSYTIAQRRRKIGIRLALGAARSSVLALVMKQGLQLTIIGVLVGLAGALGVSRLIASLLYGVAPTDPTTMVAVIMTITLAAAVASALPAWRASRLDPTTAVREE